MYLFSVSRQNVLTKNTQRNKRIQESHLSYVQSLYQIPIRKEMQHRYLRDVI